MVHPPSENVGSNDTFQIDHYIKIIVYLILRVVMNQYNPNIEKNMILDNYVESENDTFDNIQKNVYTILTFGNLPIFDNYYQ